MLSKTSTIVINAVVELARLPKGKRAGAVHIAKTIKAPRNYLGKLLKSLAQRGLLTSQKGLNGGFQLNKKPEKIKLYDIVEPIDNVSLWQGCALGMKKCEDKNPCAVHHKWKHVKSKYMDFLENTTIADLI